MGWERSPWTDVKNLHHATTNDAWMGIRKICTPGYGADRHTRREACYSLRSFVRHDEQNLHTTTPGYKFEHKKSRSTWSSTCTQPRLLA
eukprot:2593377-Pyramimonas_sp.AAC.1